MSEGITESTAAEVSETPAESAPVEGAAPVADAKATLADPNATKAEKKEAASTIKEFQLKVYGKDVTAKLDLSNEAEVRAALQKAYGFDHAAQEKSTLEKGLINLVELLKNDPESVLTHADVGVDMEKFIEKYQAKKAAENAKTPEQKEIERLQNELKDRLKKDETEKATREAEEKKRLEDQLEASMTQDVKNALEAVKLPYSEKAVNYLAHYAKVALANGYDLSMTDIAPLVLDQMVKEYNAMLGAADDDTLSKFISKDINGRLQKQRLAKLKPVVETANSVKQVAPKKEAVVDKRPKQKLSDWMKP